MRDQLEVARDRLERVRRELGDATQGAGGAPGRDYKADEPDALTVVLEADGFADLLERTEFLERISDQDREIVERVRGAARPAKKQANQLPEARGAGQLAAEGILRRRDKIAGAREPLCSRGPARLGPRRRPACSAGARQPRASWRTTSSRSSASGRACRPRSRATGAGADQAGLGPADLAGQRPRRLAVRQRWGRLHAGLDIAVPAGTPIRAADGGREVMMASTGGYGNYTCIQHTGELSTCYAHQSSFATSDGAAVRQGQVIGYVGSTGHSTGPHLHFETRINGSPVDPHGLPLGAS